MCHKIDLHPPTRGGPTRQHLKLAIWSANAASSTLGMFLGPDLLGAPKGSQVRRVGGGGRRTFDRTRHHGAQHRLHHMSQRGRVLRPSPRWAELGPAPGLVLGPRRNKWRHWHRCSSKSALCGAALGRMLGDPPRPRPEPPQSPTPDRTSAELARPRWDYPQNRSRAATGRAAGCWERRGGVNTAGQPEKAGEGVDKKRPGVSLGPSRMWAAPDRPPKPSPSRNSRR